MSRNIELEAWLEKWREYLPAEAIQTFSEITGRLDTIAQTKVGENLLLEADKKQIQDQYEGAMIRVGKLQSTIDDLEQELGVVVADRDQLQKEKEAAKYYDSVGRYNDG